MDSAASFHDAAERSVFRRMKNRRPLIRRRGSLASHARRSAFRPRTTLSPAFTIALSADEASIGTRRCAPPRQSVSSLSPCSQRRIRWNGMPAGCEYLCEVEAWPLPSSVPVLIRRRRRVGSKRFRLSRPGVPSIRDVADPPPA